MKYIELNCENLLHQEQAHLYLAEKLNFPDYYGKNLDALFDCLTELDACTVALCGTAHGYGERIQEVFEDAAQANPNLHLEIKKLDRTGEKSMELNEMISRRKSVRKYADVPVSRENIEKIRDFAAQLKPLYPDIRVRWEISTRDQVKCIFPWTGPQQIVIFSEDKPGAKENIGFMFQQLELYIQSLGLGVCWLGMGKISDSSDLALDRGDGLRFVIMLAFGSPVGGQFRAGLEEFKRKPLSEISDQADARLEPARLAPSSVNSQPWYFTHAGHAIQAYCACSGLLKKAPPSGINLIDMGIALAHLYVVNPESFRFFNEPYPAAVKGYSYVGSLVI